MPIYDYRCVACGHTVEVIHPIGAEGPSSCEVCGAAMRKALSSPAIHFKGSGWAKKDAQSAARKSASTEKADGAGEAGDAKKPAAGESASASGSASSDAGPAGTSSKGETKGSPTTSTSSGGTD